MTQQQIALRLLEVEARRQVIAKDMAALDKEALKLIEALGPISAPGSRKGPRKANPELVQKALLKRLSTLKPSL